MQIESLKVFCDLAETTSFTKAAEINGVTQSAVSQQISTLENRLGATFIERSKKKFTLSKEGEALYKYSKQIIQTYDELCHKIQEIQSISSSEHTSNTNVNVNVNGSVEAIPNAVAQAVIDWSKGNIMKGGGYFPPARRS